MSLEGMFRRHLSARQRAEKRPKRVRLTAATRLLTLDYKQRAAGAEVEARLDAQEELLRQEEEERRRTEPHKG